MFCIVLVMGDLCGRSKKLASISAKGGGLRHGDGEDRSSKQYYVFDKVGMVHNA